MTISSENQEFNSNGTEGSVFDLSVIIPTYDRYDHLAKTCDYLSEQTGCSYEILIIDQTPKSRRRRLADQNGRYFEQEIPSASAARNLGLIQARAEIVMFLDDDVIIKNPRFLTNHLRHYADPSILGVAGAAPDLGQKILFQRHRFFREGGLGWAYFPSNQGSQAWLKVGRSNNLSVRRQAAIDCGGMDEQYEKGAHREEADFGLRLNRESNGFIYDPFADLIHVGSTEGGIRSWQSMESPKAIHHMVGDLYCMRRNVSMTQRPEYLLLSLRYFVFPRGLRTPFRFWTAALKQYLKAWSVADSKIQEGPKFISEG